MVPRSARAYGDEIDNTWREEKEFQMFLKEILSTSETLEGIARRAIQLGHSPHHVLPAIRRLRLSGAPPTLNALLSNISAPTVPVPTTLDPPEPRGRNKKARRSRPSKSDSSDEHVGIFVWDETEAGPSRPEKMEPQLRDEAATEASLRIIAAAGSPATTADGSNLPYALGTYPLHLHASNASHLLSDTASLRTRSLSPTASCEVSGSSSPLLHPTDKGKHPADGLPPLPSPLIHPQGRLVMEPTVEDEEEEEEEEEDEEMVEDGVCRICFSATSDAALSPCGHAELCMGCAKEIVELTKDVKNIFSTRNKQKR
ncbi:hypothetical protein HDU96_001817 [Phlyctochytrium bullatum]|nr:hypothetical protein HDU96_001817 [Phlyctochytrium bullatum]